MLHDKNVTNVLGVSLDDVLAGTAKIPISTVRNTLSTLSSDIRKSAVGSVTGETPEVGALKLLKNIFN